MSVTDSVGDLEQTLHERFGLEQFRRGQREVIEQILQGRDVLCVMPTGGGKSLCYQLPALRLDGLTLVVSPLIALMKDQVDALLQRGIRATLINSTLEPAEQYARIAGIEEGRYDLVYVAPERFRSGRFVETMKRVRIALLAVDEAHCISEWGHDFRPDYARIGHARRQLGSPTCIALTATATDLVRRDIADQLDLRDPAQFVTGFDRPNLFYGVIEARRDADKMKALAEVLDRNPGPAIVYASSRARCEAVGQFLERELRKPTVIYHAGLGREERTSAQERFMRGEAEVVVATNAFGMGVDKADIRSVVHFNMPGTLEAYYQEAGRAGRDGKAAQCILLYAFADRFLQEMFIENEYPPPDAVYRVYDYLRTHDADPIELTQAEIREGAKVDVHESAVGTALKILEGVGALERFRPRENMAIVRINAEPEEPSLVDRLGAQAHIQRTVMLGLEGLVNRRLSEPVYFHPDELATALGLDRTALNRALRHLTAELPIDYIPPFRGNAVRIIDRGRRARDLAIDFSGLDARKRQEYDKLERMIKYAQTTKCRRAYILGYFGDVETTQCGHCDTCGPQAKPAADPTAPAIDTAAGREVIMKVLSGVARTKGRFGKTTVAQMLTGSSSEKMARWGLTGLSTFGIIAEFRQPEVVQILDALTDVGLVEQQDVDRFRPIVTLTPEGWSFLRNKGATEMPLSLPHDLAHKVRQGGLTRLTPRPEPRRAEHPSSESEEPMGEAEAFEPELIPSTEDDPLRERLKALRTEWARDAKQPAYCIFSNQTLDELVRERPLTPHSLAGVKGMGPARLERYGAVLLEEIQKFPGSPDGSESRIPEPAPVRSPVAAPLGPVKTSTEPALEPSRDSRPYVSTEEWTWRLLDRGFTPEEAAAIRGLDLQAILRHATSMAHKGRPIPLEVFLSTEQIGRWDAWHKSRGSTPPPEPHASASLWQLFLACQQQDAAPGDE